MPNGPHNRKRRKTRLSEITGPEPCRIIGELLCTQPCAAPISGLRSAAFSTEVGKFVQLQQRDKLSHYGVEATSIEVFVPVVELVTSNALVLTTPDGTVEVPAGSFSLDFPDANDHGATLLSGELPAALRNVWEEEAMIDAIAAFRERSISTGDRVELRAVVAPKLGAERTWVVRPELERARIIDQDATALSGWDDRRVMVFFILIATGFLVLILASQC